MKVTVKGLTYPITFNDTTAPTSSLIALDTETTMTESYNVPDMVCLQAFDGKTVRYFDAENAGKYINNIPKTSHLVFHNAKFDLYVLEKINVNLHDFIHEQRLHDTLILNKLYGLAHKGMIPNQNDLATLSLRICGIKMDKTIRTEFYQYYGKPLNMLPKELVEYGAVDVIATRKLYQNLLRMIKPYDAYNTLLSENIQVKGSYALKGIHINGIGFDLTRKDKALKELNIKLEEYKNRLLNWGWERGRKGNKDVFLNILEMLGIKDKLPLTDKKNISTKAEVLDEYRDIEFVDDYLNFMETEKIASFVSSVENPRTHPKYNDILNTGRTSCSGAKSGSVNIQQIPRSGGVRELFIPEEGNVLIDIDYSAIELAGLAQICKEKYGFSVIGDLINEGKCLHYYMASQIYGKPEDKITKDERQFAKIPNFAFPTNMGTPTFIKYCKTYGVTMSKAQAERFKDAYKSAYPEIREHYWKSTSGGDAVFTLSGRRRADCTYTAYLNTQFQGLCADGAKLALYNVARAGYKIVAFVHDQIVVESEKDTAEEEMENISKIMVDSMKEFIPDIKISVEGEIRDRWGK